MRSGPSTEPCGTPSARVTAPRTHSIINIDLRHLAVAWRRVTYHLPNHKQLGSGFIFNLNTPRCFLVVFGYWREHIKRFYSIFPVRRVPAPITIAIIWKWLTAILFCFLINARWYTGLELDTQGV